MIPARKPPTGKPTPIAYPQLCALARQQLLADPTMPDSEWRARVKDRFVQLGFAYPPPDQFAAALAAVEYTLPRPKPAPPAAASPRRLEPSKPTPREWDAMTRTVRRLVAPAPRSAPEGWTRLGDTKP
jgi:hypothetical protein